MTGLQNQPVAKLPVDLARVFSRETIIAIPRSAEKSEVLTKLVQSLANAGRFPCASVSSVVEALRARERAGTTGLGKGLALPNLRCREVAESAGAIGVAPAGVDFDSLDGQPTRLILLVLSPFDKREKHAQIMARLAKLLSDKTLQYAVQFPRAPRGLVSISWILRRRQA